MYRGERMKKITIFTPTYNRGYCLPKLYGSLKGQTSKEFIWLIVDDGSTDDTRLLVEKWILEKDIEIQYYYQDNQGMHGAHNTAYELIKTELNVCIDSDDYMPERAVEKILWKWNKSGNDKVAGIIGLDSYSEGMIIGTKLPETLESSKLFDLYYKYGVEGDKKLVYRTEITKNYPYPIFYGEKYVGLAYKYYMIDKDYKLLLLNEVLCCVEYLPDGSSLNMFNQYRKNPKGFSFYRKELMKLPFTSTSFKFRQAIHYVSSNLMLKNWRFILESPQKGLTTLAIPFGFLLYYYIHTKTKAA
jgi:glycosyltransferase involved in cell wall biosynthesis